MEYEARLRISEAPLTIGDLRRILDDDPRLTDDTELWINLERLGPALAVPLSIGVAFLSGPEDAISRRLLWLYAQRVVPSGTGGKRVVALTEHRDAVAGRAPSSGREVTTSGPDLAALVGKGPEGGIAGGDDTAGGESGRLEPESVPGNVLRDILQSIRDVVPEADPVADIRRGLVVVGSGLTMTHAQRELLRLVASHYGCGVAWEDQDGAASFVPS